MKQLHGYAVNVGNEIYTTTAAKKMNKMVPNPLRKVLAAT